MNRFCPNCGNEIPDGTNFCSKCGNNINGNQNETVIINNNYNTNNSFKLPERNIALCLIFSILTCGIYGIYWFICITDEANAASGEGGTSGGMAFLFTLITCGIYGIYWAYRIGQKLAQAGKNQNKAIGDNAILYLILQFLGLGIINYCLMQNDLNKFSK